MPRRSDLEKQLGVSFKDKGLLQQALVHSSFVNERPKEGTESNERMEFLGDAVLGLVVAHDLFATLPDMDEGSLTEQRTHLVRRDTLADAARRLGLGEALLLGRGEEGGGGRDRPTNLAHVYEAVVGAIYLDRGLEAASDFVRHSLSEELARVGNEPYPADAKSQLQEITQSRHQTTPHYHVTKAEGPDHARRFTVEVTVDGQTLGTGRGTSKQEAEKEAARQALTEIEARAGDDPTGMSNVCT